MNHANAIALGLSALVVGAVASTSQRATAEGGGRSLPPPIGRHAFAVRDDVQVYASPSPTAPVQGTFGLGSGFLVGPEATPGWFPIIREWIEGNQRIARDLGFVPAADISFTDPRAVTASAARAATGATTPSLGRTDGGECDAFVKLAWPHGVDDFKARLDTLFSATDASIRACSTLGREQQDSWALFLAQWKRFAATPTPTFGSGADWDTACSYSRTLDGWRDVLASTRCSVVGPSTVHGYEVPTSTENSLESIATIVKWGALGVGSAVLISTFYPEIRAGLAAIRARTMRK